MNSLARRTLDRLYRLSGLLGAGFLLAIGCTVLAQVLANIANVGARVILGLSLGLTIPSYTEFAEYFLAAASFLALAYTFREGSHIRVLFIVEQLHGRRRCLAEAWCTGLAAVIVACATVYATRLVLDSWHFGDTSPGLVPVPLWLPQGTMLVGLAVFGIAVSDAFVRAVSAWWKAPKDGPADSCRRAEED